MTKHRGGRGRRAKNKHQTVTISLLPELKAALDAAVTDETSRSEVVAGLIERHLLKPKPTVKTSATSSPKVYKPRTGPQKATPELLSLLQKKSEGNSRQHKPKTTNNLPHAVTVIEPRCPRGEAMRWNRERYETTDALLSEGYTITRNTENADYHTEKGSIMSWRTVQALLKLGVVVPAMA